MNVSSHISLPKGKLTKKLSKKLTFVEYQDGIFFDFVNDFYYIKPVGKPPRVAPLQSLASYTCGNQGMYLNSSGVLTQATTNTPIKEARISTLARNLVLQSETFDNASWTKSGGAFVAGTVFADGLGTTKAQRFIPTAGGTFHLFRQDVSPINIGNLQTFSIYARPAGYNQIRIQYTNQAETDGARVDVNLDGGNTSNLTAIGTGSLQAVTVTPAANGYFRIALSCIVDASSFLGRVQILAMGGGTTSFSADGTSGFDFHAAQLNWGGNADTYVATTTAIGYLNSAPSQRGLVIEPASTNIALNSGALNSGTWTPNACTVSPNVSTGPDGTVSMDRIVEDNTIAIHGLIAGVTIVAGGTYCLSAFIRPNGRKFAFLYGTNVDQFGATFDLVNGTTGNILSGTSTITASGIISYPNGVYRIWVSGVMNAAGTTLNFVGGPGVSLASPAGYTYQGDSTSGCDMWGIQIEGGTGVNVKTKPSSYIPTAGAGVTRTTSTLTLTPLGTEYDQTVGTVDIVADWMAYSAASSALFSFDDNSFNNFVLLAEGGSGTFVLNLTSGGAGQVFISRADPTVDTVFKVSSAWQLNDVNMAMTGVLGTNDNAAVMPTGVNFLRIGNSAGNAFGNMHIQSFRYAPVRQPNATILQRGT